MAPRDSAGTEMHDLVADLYPICRSITGEGVRQTLRRIAEAIPLEIHAVPSGTQVFDWTVPKEWSIREAWIRDADGRTVVDFAEHNLHVVSYSTPVRARLSLDELRPHLHSDPAHPDWIPYRTSYYNETWGFCVQDRALQALPEGDYEVFVDSTLADGHLNYGECCLRGSQREEVLVSIHVCHPSLANDNLSGVAVAVALAQRLQATSHRYTYRFLFIPGTIGSITWLALNESRLDAIRHGLVAVNLGDPGPMNYKRSRRGDAEIDRIAELVLRARGPNHGVVDFSPYGYDERQYCSPGVDLAVGCLMRTPHGQFPEYHTSADNLDLIRPEALADSLETYWSVFQALERNATYRNLSPKGEPQLGRRGLYASLGGRSDTKALQMAMLWVLNQSDGDKSILDIAERSGIALSVLADAADLLERHDLVARVEIAS